MKKKRRSTPSVFSKNLTSLMEEKKMTLKKASQIAGVGISTNNSWRSGALPEDYNVVKKLAKFLGVSLSFILTGEDDSRSSGPPAINEVFQKGDELFNGYALIKVLKLIPRSDKNEFEDD